MWVLVAVLREEHEFVSRDVPRINVEAEIWAKILYVLCRNEAIPLPSVGGGGKALGLHTTSCVSLAIWVGVKSGLLYVL